MTIRKGLTAGSGRKGYYNVIGKDPSVHRMSAKGIKQPQRVQNLPMGKVKIYRDGKLLASVKDEAEAYHWLHRHQGQSVSHATKYEGYKIVGGKWQYGDRSITEPEQNTLENRRIIYFRKLAIEKDIDPVIFEEYMMRAHPHAAHQSYAVEWANRFKSGNPMQYMDKEHRLIFRSVINDFERKRFGKEGMTKGGKWAEWYATMPTANPALTKASNEKLEEGMIKEHIEHPKLTFEQARQIAKDHLRDNPRAYGKYKKAFVVQGFQFPSEDNFMKKLSQPEMVKYAKENLRVAKLNGLDKNITSKDLNDPLFAWKYLQSVNLGVYSKPNAGEQGGKGQWKRGFRKTGRGVVHAVDWTKDVVKGGKDDKFSKSEIRAKIAENSYGEVGTSKMLQAIAMMKYNKGGKMSRKDYVKMADLVGKIKDPKERMFAQERYILMAKEDNPSFDPQRFSAAVEKTAKTTI